MDLPLALRTELDLEDASAAGLAGALLLLVEDVVREQASYGLATTLRDAIPELHDWQTSAPTLAPGMLTLDSLPPPSAPGVDGELVAVLSRFSVPADRAPLAASLVLRFLAARLPPETARAIVDAMPVLIGRTGA